MIGKNKGPQSIRVPEPVRPDGYVCALHPWAPVEYDPEEESWHCGKCGLDVQDTFGLVGA